MLDLANVKSNINQLIDDYNLCVNRKRFLLDGDLEELFESSNITIGDVTHKEKDWAYSESGWLIGCVDGDYLESIELVQNGIVYLCQAFSDRCGDGLDYTLSLFNLEKMGRVDRK